jgi:hypothetical protein
MVNERPLLYCYGRSQVTIVTEYGRYSHVQSQKEKRSCRSSEKQNRQPKNHIKADKSVTVTPMSLKIAAWLLLWT